MGYTKDKDGNWVLSDSYVSSVEKVITDCVETKERREKYIEFKKKWDLQREDRYKEYLNTMTEQTELFYDEWINNYLTEFYWEYIELLNEVYGWKLEKDFTDPKLRKIIFAHVRDVVIKFYDECINDLGYLD